MRLAMPPGEDEKSFAMPIDSRNAKRMLGDIVNHGYLALQECGFNSKAKYNEIASRIAEHCLLRPNMTGGSRDSEVMASLFIGDGGTLVFQDVREEMPALIALFAMPQPELYKQFMTTSSGRDLMEWLSIGEGGAYSLSMLATQRTERFQKLSNALFLEKRTTPHVEYWCSSLINALTVTNFQYFICCGESVVEVEHLISNRAISFLSLIADPVDFYLKLKTNTNKALLPFPAVWGAGGVTHPQQFLGFPRPSSTAMDPLSGELWGGSALRFFFESSFFYKRSPHDYKTLSTYITKLEAQGLSEECLCTEGMLLLLDSNHAFALSFGSQFAALYLHNTDLASDAVADYDSPITVFYLGSDFPGAKKQFMNQLSLVLTTQYSRADANFVLGKLRDINCTRFAECADGYLRSKPLVSGIRKLFNHLDDPAHYADLLPPSLLSALLESDLGL